MLFYAILLVMTKDERSRTDNDEYSTKRKAMGLFLGGSLVATLLWSAGVLRPTVNAVGGAAKWALSPVGGKPAQTPSQFDKKYPKVYVSQPGQTALGIAVESVGPSAVSNDSETLQALALIDSQLPDDNAQNLKPNMHIHLPSTSVIGQVPTNTSNTP